MRTIVLATRNAGKANELRRLLVVASIALLDLNAAGVTTELAEDGTTFEANARQKAEQVRDLTRLPAVGDDSGLCVAALDDAPGVFSRQFGGEHLSDAQRAQHLVRALAGVPAVERTARLVTVLAFARPGETTIVARGVLEGLIATEPTGVGGFGYDPVFFVPALGTTLAAVPLAVKNRISHRAQAAAALRPILRVWAGAKPTRG